MSDHDKGQLTSDSAEIYEEFYIPALFLHWAERVADAVKIRPGQNVLDVACGTGVVARTVADRVGLAGSVVRIDTNKGMLRVLRPREPLLSAHRLTSLLPPRPDGTGLYWIQYNSLIARILARMIPARYESKWQFLN